MRGRVDGVVFAHHPPPRGRETDKRGVVSWRQSRTESTTLQRYCCSAGPVVSSTCARGTNERTFLARDDEKVRPTCWMWQFPWDVHDVLLWWGWRTTDNYRIEVFTPQLTFLYWYQHSTVSKTAIKTAATGYREHFGSPNGSSAASSGT